MAIVQVDKLWKKYKRFDSPWARLLEWGTLCSIQNHEPRWALKNISFTLRKGEALGIIGANGSGKTSLLNILSKITQPTRGNFEVRGSIATILGLGTGFHPNFTGYHNAIMGCYLRGFLQREVKQCLPGIVDFSELGDSIKDPLRTYSSGMQMRLAFAVATAQRPDVLIIDEALAVGDLHFKEKCFTRIKEFIREGTNLLFVSHGLEMVRTLCERSILLHQGEILHDGPSAQIIRQYQQLRAQKTE